MPLIYEHIIVNKVILDAKIRETTFYLENPMTKVGTS